MLALIEQAVNSTGEGLINPTLYTLASNSSTYASAFHDITSGGNQCLGGTSYCSTAGAADYAATTGYDEASGLGSIDLFHLLTAWPTTSASSLAATVITLAPATLAPAIGASDVITITVAPVSTNAAVPTGTVALVIDGVAATSSTTVTLVNGVASYTFPAASSTAGTHVINATYSGDATFASSTATVTLAVAAPLVGSFTLTAANVSVAAGGSVTSSASAVPAGGYTGTIILSLTIPNNLTNFCINDASNLGEIVVTGTSPVADNLTIYTNSATCQSLGLSVETKSGTPGGSRTVRIQHRSAAQLSASLNKSHYSPRAPFRNRLPIPAALAGTLLLFTLGRRRSGKSSRKLLRAGLTLGILAMLSIGGLSLTACSSSTATSPAVATLEDTPVGAYPMTLTGTDSVNSSQTASVNFTLTVN